MPVCQLIILEKTIFTLCSVKNYLKVHYTKWCHNLEAIISTREIWCHPGARKPSDGESLLP